MPSKEYHFRHQWPSWCRPPHRLQCSLLFALITTSCCGSSSAQGASAASGGECYGIACPAAAWRTNYSRPPLPLDPHLPHPFAFPFHVPQPFGSVTLPGADCCPLGALPLPLPPLPRRPRMVFVLGAMKGGSTTLYQLLTLHPQIASWRRRYLYRTGELGELFGDKESHCLSGSSQFTHADIDMYLRGWRHAHPDALWLDATPSYVHLPAVACRIRAAFPDARLIITLRNPLLRAVSQHQHDLRMEWNRHFNFTSFDDRVQRELRILADLGCTFPLQQLRPANAVTGLRTMAAWGKLTGPRKLASAGDFVSGAQGTRNQMGRASLVAEQPAATAKDEAVAAAAAAAAGGEKWLSGVKASWNKCFKCYYTDMCHPASRLYETSAMRQHCATDRRRDDLDWMVMRGMYAPMIANWLRFFPSDQIYIVNMQDQVEQLPEIFKFLGLPPIKLDSVSASAALAKVRMHSGEHSGKGACSGFVKLAGPAMQRLDEVYRDQNRVLYQLMNMMGLKFSRFFNPCNATGGGSEILM